MSIILISHRYQITTAIKYLLNRYILNDWTFIFFSFLVYFLGMYECDAFNLCIL